MKLKNNAKLNCSLYGSARTFSAFKTWKISLLSIYLPILLLLYVHQSHAQQFEFGLTSTFGRSYTTFKGELSEIVGFDELELSTGQVDTALASIDLNAPNWLKDLFPGIRIDIDQTLTKQLSRNNRSAQFFARYAWIGGSFMISDPRLSPQLPSKKISNQIKSLRFSINGEAEALSKHLANLALEDSKVVSPFFQKRYDLDLYIHLKKLLLGNEPLFEWAENGALDIEVTTGLRLTADPSPIVDLGSILFISERLDSLMEGRLLNSVESTTDQIAQAIQSTVFGKFKDPRIVSSMGWFIRGQMPVELRRGVAVLLGIEANVNQHLSVKGTKPMFSTYGYLGLRWSYR